MRHSWAAAVVALWALTGCAEPAGPPLVVVDVFMNLASPQCARAEHVMERIQEAWPRDVQVRHRHLPLRFHRRAHPAAIAVEAAAAQDAGKQMRRRLFASIEKWPKANTFEAFLRKLAAEEGLDTTRFAEDLDSKAIAARVDRDRRVAGLLDVKTPPAVFVNGLRIAGPVDFASISPTLRSELTAARSAVMQGEARAEVVGTRTRTHMGDPQRAAWLMGLQPPPMELPGAGTKPRRRRLRPQRTQVSDDDRWAVPVDATSPRQGTEEGALVTIVLFEDLSSPFSKRLHPTLNALLSTNNKDVRLTYRHLPLPHNPDAKHLAYAAHCAHEQGQFWTMRDLLLTHESPDVETIARTLKLDVKAFAECLASPRPTQRISADALMARRVSVGGTPVLFVNGHKSAGAKPLDELSALVDQERADARTRLATQDKTRSKSALYDVITKHGRARVPLAATGTPVSELPAATLGAEASMLSVQAWLDLSDERQRRSLKTLVQAARTRDDLRLALFPADSGDDEHAQAWRRAFWCAKAQGKVWRLLDAAAAASRHTHLDPAAPVTGDEHGDDHDALEGVLRTSEVDPDTCRTTPMPPAMFRGPTWLVNGRRYDGSMGWGPPALKRVLMFATGAP